MGRVLPKTIEEKEFLEILSKTKDKKLRLAFSLGFYNCLRVSEVKNLRSQDVDKERGFLHLKQAKGNKDRDVPIMAPVKKGLRYLPIDCSIRTLQRAIKKAGKDYIGKDIHFHTLRHSGATHYLNKGAVDIRHIQTLLGHSRLTTTEIYTHVTPNALKDVFTKMWES